LFLLRVGGDTFDQEDRMDAVGQDGDQRTYTTPRWVQVWFLRRSRDNWKKKHQKLKVESKRLLNRVNDVTKSRAKWRQRVEELETENAALRERAALKKGAVPVPESAEPAVPGESEPVCC
jgi:hypothetical protein